MGIAFFSGPPANELAVYSLKSYVSSVLANASGYNLGASWASDDRLLYSTLSAGYYQMMWLNVSTGTTGPLFNDSANYVSPSMGPGGQVAYYSDFNPGQNSDYLQGYGGFNVWTSATDGTQAVYQSSSVHVTEGSPIMVDVPYVPGKVDTSAEPAWNRNGTQVVYSAFSTGFGSTLYLWDLNSASTATIGPVGIGVDCVQPSWSPSGNLVAFSSDLGGYYHIWVTSTTGAPQSTGNGGYQSGPMVTLG